jgi:hypothetical protein
MEVDVNPLLHTSAVFFPGKDHPVPIEWEAAWVTSLVFAL